MLAFAVLVCAGCAQPSGAANPGTDAETCKVRLTVAGLPSEMTSGSRSLALTVSAPDMEAQSFTYTAVPSEVTAEVQAGKARSLTLLAYTGAGYPSALNYYRGTATADLEPGGTTTLTLDMKAGEMKLVVPDDSAGRLVIMDDMKGSGWTNKTAADFGLPSGCFMPYDVDVDAQGNVYVSNFVYASVDETVPYLMKITDLKKNTYEGFLPNLAGASCRVAALAVDRGRNYLYFTQYLDETHTLQAIDLADGTIVSFGGVGMERISGLAVDAEGMVYACGKRYDQQDLKGAVSTFRITGAAGALQCALVGTLFFDAGFSPRDILAKDGYFLVATEFPSNGYRLFKLDKAMVDPPVACGRQIDYAATAYTAAKGLFYGPSAFIALTNAAVYLIDDDNCLYQTLTFDGNRIVSFDDPEDWRGWSALRASDAGQTPFKFYVTP